QGSVLGRECISSVQSASSSTSYLCRQRSLPVPDLDRQYRSRLEMLAQGEGKAYLNGYQRVAVQIPRARAVGTAKEQSDHPQQRNYKTCEHFPASHHNGPSIAFSGDVLRLPNDKRNGRAEDKPRASSGT